MRVIVTTPLKVTLSLAFKLEPPPRSASYPDWYTPLERYVSYGVDQDERVMKGIRRLKRQMDDFAHVQTEMQASIDSHTSMMYDLFGHFWE
jgi:hypothetical protein